MSDTATLLRLTSSQEHLVQALQIMGPNLQGKMLLVTGHSRRTLGVTVSGSTVTSLIPIDKYLAAIGQSFYDRLLRLELKELNSLFERQA